MTVPGRFWVAQWDVVGVAWLPVVRVEAESVPVVGAEDAKAGPAVPAERPQGSRQPMVVADRNLRGRRMVKNLATHVRISLH